MWLGVIYNLGKINLEPFHPAVSMICGVAAGACLALPCLTCMCAVVCSADLCGSLPWTDHCFGHHICSLLAQLSFLDHCFGCLFLPIQRPALPTSQMKWFVVRNRSVKFLNWSLFSVTVLAGGCLQGSRSQGCQATNRWWHQFPSSSIGNELKLQ